ncbi:hypothetical protein [Amycolatopsis sp. Hca4]|uniref:hypothetical protein n=1 Tax=Amycolatopsis sp. Hca4 TaxID=2742131 RepID=UPI001591AD1F|nr:hypothetical protein [Amycolatopsis sp. Hca4]QKV75292.1 hypothetical protein HUT10_17080 [Amycolatopsis sp. Hca4]
MADRNPYLVLGVDYAAPPEAARRSFARAARRIRKAAGGAVTIEDLNWALHEIQERHSEAEDDVSVYRVPANPAAFHPSGDGAFAPVALPLARRTATSDSDREQVLAGLADDVWALLGAATPCVARFDHGYHRTREDRA